MLPLFRQFGALLLIALAPALACAAFQLKWQSDAPLEPGEVRAATARLWGAQVLWVDARSRQQFEKEHIKGAVLLDNADWESLLPGFFAAWSAEKTVVVYDQETGAAAPLAERLKNELKIESVYVLKGGYKAWRR